MCHLPHFEKTYRKPATVLFLHFCWCCALQDSTGFAGEARDNLQPSQCFVPWPSAAQLSQQFCGVVRHLMEGSSRTPSAPSSLNKANVPKQETKLISSSLQGFSLNSGPTECPLFERLSITAATAAAKALRHHLHPELARRYAKQLCELVCWGLQKVSSICCEIGVLSAKQCLCFVGKDNSRCAFSIQLSQTRKRYFSCSMHICLRGAQPSRSMPTKEGGGLLIQQEAKCLARMLQSLVNLGVEAPMLLLQ